MIDELKDITDKKCMRKRIKVDDVNDNSMHQYSISCMIDFLYKKLEKKLSKKNEINQSKN